jgi:hypothetical protein
MVTKIATVQGREGLRQSSATSLRQGNGIRRPEKPKQIRLAKQRKERERERSTEIFSLLESTATD